MASWLLGVVAGGGGVGQGARASGQVALRPLAAQRFCEIWHPSLLRRGVQRVALLVPLIAARAVSAHQGEVVNVWLPRFAQVEPSVVHVTVRAGEALYLPAW